MCKEDVRIKRKTGTRSVTVTTSAGAIVAALPANPDRVAVTIASGGGYDDNAGAVCYLVTNRATPYGVVAACSVGCPVGTATVEHLGQLVTGALFVLGGDAENPDVVVTEVFFYQELTTL